MRKRIRKDLERYKRIVRGEIRKNLRELIKHGAIVGQRGGNTVKVNLKSIQIPEFRYDPRRMGGLGQGNGAIGTPIKPGQGSHHEAKAGWGPGAHYPEVEIEVEELAKIMGEELELPNIQPKGEKTKTVTGEDYRDISTVGPETLLIKKKAYKKGLIRQMLMNDTSDLTPASIPPPIQVTPVKEDKRYLYSEPELTPEASAVIIFMRDASGSMTGEKTEILRQENYWIDLWLRVNYDNLETVYILHDYQAQEVDEEDFYRLSTGGGTKISSAYQLSKKIIDRRFPPEDWNIYPFHFSDGENWSGDTEKNCVPLLRNELLPKCNIFCYGQVSLGRKSPSLHLLALRKYLGDKEKLLTSIIKDRDGILDSIEEFLRTGK